MPWDWQLWWTEQNRGLNGTTAPLCFPCVRAHVHVYVVSHFPRVHCPSHGPSGEGWSGGLFVCERMCEGERVQEYRWSYFLTVPKGSKQPQQWLQLINTFIHTIVIFTVMEKWKWTEHWTKSFTALLQAYYMLISWLLVDINKCVCFIILEMQLCHDYLSERHIYLMIEQWIDYFTCSLLALSLILLWYMQPSLHCSAALLHVFIWNGPLMVVSPGQIKTSFSTQPAHTRQETPDPLSPNWIRIQPVDRLQDRTPWSILLKPHQHQNRVRWHLRKPVSGRWNSNSFPK